MRTRLTLIASGLLLLTLASCDGGRPAAAESQPKRDRVRLNVNPTLTYGPIMIASDEGYFAAEGIDAELVSLDSNSAVAAAASGGLDVLSAGVRSGVFNMILKGVPMQVVADKGYSKAGACASEAFIAPAQTARRIATTRTLRGERVALTRGGTIEFLSDRLLEHYKTAPTDVVIVQLPHGTAASSRDKVDAVRFASEPNLSSALAEGWAAAVATTEEVAPGHQTAILVYGKRLLRDDPELGRRFMRAYLRGVRRFNEGKTPRNVAILARHTRLPPDLIRRSCWITIAGDGRIDPNAMQPFLDWALERDYLDGEVAVAQWWNPEFVDAATQHLQVQGR